jgi:hypothetical protein
MHTKNNNEGFIKIVVLIVVIVIILGVFNINLRGIIESDMVQTNLNYLWELLQKGGLILKDVWESYLQVPLTQVWEAFLGLVQTRPQ